MPLVLRMLLILLCLIFLVVTIRLVIQKRLLLKYSMLWILTAITMLIVAIFPGPLFMFADLIGITTPSNFVFLIVLGLLFLIVLSLSIVATHQTINERKNIQEIAILKKKLEELKKTMN
ncbi:MAG: DUF2304 domain-containing protein [Eggerthellaceae bacterium]|nr:DUF2304 domain-containing protein [Eggerthellaceae bacterium]